MQPCEGSGNAEDGGTSRDTRSIQSRTEQKSDCPKCQRRRNFVHYRRSKSVHLLTPSRTQLRGAAIVHCGGIPHDPRLASSGAEHQPDLPGDGIYTVRKYLAAQTMPIPASRRTRPSKLDPYNEYIQNRLSEYPLSGARVHRRLHNSQGIRPKDPSCWRSTGTTSVRDQTRGPGPGGLGRM
jgi:hypothetical protein